MKQAKMYSMNKDDCPIFEDLYKFCQVADSPAPLFRAFCLGMKVSKVQRGEGLMRTCRVSLMRDMLCSAGSTKPCLAMDVTN